jgi:hypothetical protein
MRVKIRGLIIARTDCDCPTRLQFCEPGVSPRTRASITQRGASHPVAEAALFAPPALFSLVHRALFSLFLPPGLWGGGGAGWQAGHRTSSTGTSVASSSPSAGVASTRAVRFCMLLPGRFRPQLLAKNRRGIGTSQSKWTAYTMETPGSRELLERAGRLALGAALQRACPRFRPQKFLDKNRRDIGKSQSIWTDSKREKPGSRPRLRKVISIADASKHTWPGS